jgi:hypothetical protein
LREGTGNREQGTGNREQGTGNREQGTGNRKRVLSDFTFLHIPLNFSVHLLTTFRIKQLSRFEYTKNKA